MNKRVDSVFLKQLFCLLLLLIFIEACKTKQKAVIKPVVDNRPAQQLYRKQQANELNFTTLSLKADISTDIEGNNQSFDAHIRVKKDSIIWINISALAIDVARVIITPDSVKVMNRIKSNYFADDICKINDLINADFDFEMLQSILVGNSFDFYNDDRLKTSIDGNRYLLSSYKKYKLKKIINNPTVSPDRDPLQSIWLDPTSFKIVKLLLNDFATNRQMQADYSKFEVVDSVLFPRHIDINISAQKNIKATINYSKVKLNEPQTFPFKVPEKYDRIKK